MLPPDRPPTNAEIWQAALDDLRLLVAQECSLYWWLRERWRLREMTTQVHAGRYAEAEQTAQAILVLLDGDITQPPRSRRTRPWGIAFWTGVLAVGAYVAYSPACRPLRNARVSIARTSRAEISKLRAISNPKSDGKPPADRIRPTAAFTD